MPGPVGMDASVLLATTPLGAGGSDLKGRAPIEVAREFESMLLTQMIGAMRKTVGESGLLTASPQRKVLDGVFDKEMARSLVAGGGLGLAETLARQIEEQQARAGASGPGALPADGEITSRFGTRVDPLTGREQMHAGIDIAAPTGTPIRSVRDGVVVFSGERGAAGQMLEVRNQDGSVASYAHVASRLVEEGREVRAGEVIATVGSTGRSTGPHLHFAVRQGGTVVDPTPWLRPQGARPTGA